MGQGKILLALAISQLKWDLGIISFLIGKLPEWFVQIFIALLAELFEHTYSSEHHT